MKLSKLFTIGLIAAMFSTVLSASLGSHNSALGLLIGDGPGPGDIFVAAPTITDVESPDGQFTTDGGQTVRVGGTQIQTVHTVFVGAVSIDMGTVTKTNAALSFPLPANLAVGKHDLQVRGTGGRDTLLDALEVFAAEVPEPEPEPEEVEEVFEPTPYMGPIVISAKDKDGDGLTTKGGQTVIVKGLRMNSVESVELSGIVIQPTEVRQESFLFVLPPELKEGRHDLLVITRNLGSVRAIDLLFIGPAEPERSVNAGSFKGFVAVYALGHEGQRLSAKIGRDWIVIPSIPNQPNNLFRVTDYTGAGVDLNVKIYIDRQLMRTVPLTTR